MDKKNSIAILVEGESKEQLVGANFIYMLEKYLSEYHFKFCVFGGSDAILNDAIWEEQSSVFFYTTKGEWKGLQKEDYLLVMSLDIFPRVHYMNKKMVQEYAKLDYIVNEWKKFEQDWENDLYFREPESCKPYFYRRLIIQNRNVLNASDIGGKLGLSKEYQFMQCDSDGYNEIAKKFELEDKKFILLHRESYNSGNASNDIRLWPREYYEQLVIQIKETNPDIIIVQISRPGVLCEKIEGVHLDLSSVLEWKEIKALVGRSVLLIDNDTEIVHFRNILHGGKSVVLFGPTPKDFFALEGNINMSGKGCAYWCAELKEGWKTKCFNQQNANICMYSLKPEEVFKEIEEIIVGGDNK